MARSIERFRRWIRLPVTPLLMVVALVGPSKSDPVRRVTGYGGVLLVPGKAHSPAAHDPLLEEKRDVRAARGRILYSPGHEPAAAASAAPRAAHKEPCPQRSVVQARTVAALPNS